MHSFRTVIHAQCVNLFISYSMETMHVPLATNDHLLLWKHPFFYPSLLEPVPSLVSPPSVSPTESARHPALSVSWSPPQSDLPIQYYTVSYSLRDSGPVTNITTTSISLLIANLKIGATYQVAVTARSALGEGPRSVWVHQTTHSREYAVSTLATCPLHILYSVIAFRYCSSRCVVILMK